jgi:hypothetical protein
MWTLRNLKGWNNEKLKLVGQDVQILLIVYIIYLIFMLSQNKLTSTTTINM